MDIRFTSSQEKQETTDWKNLTPGLWQPSRLNNCRIIVTHSDCRFYVGPPGSGILSDADKHVWNSTRFVKREGEDVILSF